MPATPLTDEQARRLEDKYIAPGTGSIMRRHIQRLLNGIVAVGPSVLRPSIPRTTKAELAARAKHDAEIVREHAAIVADELKAIDRRIRDIDHMLAAPARPGLWGSGADYESQEVASEKRCLVALRAEIEADLTRPITTDRDGRPLTDRDRAIIRERANSLRSTCWDQAEMYRRQGLFRESRRWRLDALRTRFLAESEMNWRPALSTYW